MSHKTRKGHPVEARGGGLIEFGIWIAEWGIEGTELIEGSGSFSPNAFWAICTPFTGCQRCARGIARASSNNMIGE